MRKLLTILLMIPITFMFVSTHNFGLSAKNDFSELKEEIFIANSYISKNHPEEKTTVKSYEIIKDTNENDSFILFKLNPVGYMFYSKENSEFVEYSFKDVSPYEYFGVDNEDKIYLGPTLYFTSHEEDVYCDVKHVYSYSKEALGIIESSFKESLSLEFSHRKESKILEPSNTKAATTIPKINYFKNLVTFPINDRGTCGWTAGSILLGYFDTFHNNNTVADKWMEGKSTGGTSYTGLPSGMSYMPGAVSGLDDILMNGRAYGTVASNVKSALIDYFDNISTTIKNDFEINTQFWPFVGTQAKNHINDGYPYLLFGNYIDPSNGNNIKHVVTAYAYNGNNFQVHFGWSGGYREVWINGTHGTGLGMRYKGSHIHSENVYFGSTCKSMCGCGHETASHGTHTHIHHIYDGTAGERINYDQHRIGCSDCGFSRWENHNWYNPPFSWSIYCTICYQHLYI